MDQSCNITPAAAEHDPVIAPVGVHPALDFSRLIKSAENAARFAGSIDEPISILSEAQLNAPIDPHELELPPPIDALTIRNYRIVNRIDSGGQATVFEAVQESTGRSVAIKVVPGGPFISSNRRARFEREADLLATLDHPNIVGILERGRTLDGSFFFVMDLIVGRSLDEWWIESDRSQGDGKPQLLMFSKVARAVAEAHRCEIVHRDLKPSNIRVDRFGEPHILDFGLARLTSNADASTSLADLTQTGQLVGSLPWASPEQTSGRDFDCDSRTDVYSLGVMLYQFCTGGFPYPVGDSLRDTFNHIASTVPHRPSRRGLVLDFKRRRWLDAIVLKALSKAPEDRYQTAADLADDLDNYLAGRHVLARQRWRPPPNLLVAAIIVGVCLSAVAVMQKTKLPQQSPVRPLRNLTNSIGMQLVWVPPGRFQMGSPPGEAGRTIDENSHTVELTHSYFIGATEVTQSQFQAVMHSNPSDQKNRGPDEPVDNLTFADAVEFCHRLSDREHRHYRLPTEAEWECACRAGDENVFAASESLNDLGWWAGNSDGVSHAVATKRPNFWGIFDMHGGVEEMCSDFYGAYSPSTEADPKGPPFATKRSVRGGCYASAMADCRSAKRGAVDPNIPLPWLGFRVVLDPTVDVGLLFPAR